jgi:heterodisulfide reductase subunit A
MYGYDGGKVVTQLELERLLKEDRLDADKVVMIQCVGGRDETRNYCSRVCCVTALKNAQIILEGNPEAQVFILYRDMQTYGTVYEAFYRKAREAGIIFVKYSPQKPPVVDESVVKVFDGILGEELCLPYDVLVLSTPMVAHPDSGELAKMLKVPVDEYGFFLEAHVKLKPLDFATDGVYLCGSAHWPSTVSESIAQAYGAASRASIPMSRRRVIVEGIIAVVDEEKCSGCRICEVTCEYGAIKMYLKDGRYKAEVLDALCKGCGCCSSGCPAKAITLHHFTDSQILAQLEATLSEAAT